VELAELRNLRGNSRPDCPHRFHPLHYSFLLLIVTLIGLCATYLLAWIAFFTLEDPGWLLASTAISIMTATYGATVRFYGLPWLWALTLPFAAVFYGYATFLSALRYWLGRGGQWKGRAQAQNR